MSIQPAKTIAEVVRDIGRYPEHAFDFVRDGLAKAVEGVHGPPTPAHIAISAFLEKYRFDYGALYDLHVKGRLGPEIEQAIRDAGGFERLNRHVSGQELCWALRDLALERWGEMARLVLAHWKVTETTDFGRIVFAMIKHHLMQKQPQDRLSDFADVFEFRDAFSTSLTMRGER